MWALVIGLLIFFGVHSVRMVGGELRDRQIAINKGRWKGLYSLVSAVGLALVIWGWILYRPEAPQIYAPPIWGRHVTLLLMWLAFVLLAAAEMRPGHIKAITRHPMLVGVFLWAAGHLLANGDLASLLLFGTFLVYVVADRLAVATRGEPAPVALAPRSDLIAIAVGTALYLLFVFWLHELLFGVAPLA